MKARLRLCPDKDCLRLCTFGTDEQYDNGGSFFCWGRLGEESVLKFKERTHKNAYSYCVGSPLKGIIRYLVSPDDALLNQTGFGEILKDHQSSSLKETK